MNVSSLSRFALAAAVVVAAVAAFSPRYGGAAVAAGLASVPIALLLAPWLRRRMGREPVAAPMASRDRDTRFAAPLGGVPNAVLDPTVELSCALLLLAAGASWRLVRQVSFEDPTWLLLAGLVAGALLAVWALVIGVCNRRSLAPAFAGFALAGGAAAGWLDVIADREPPVHSQVAVTRRDVEQPEWLARHELELGVGATRLDWRRVVVDVSDRRHLFLGSTACLEEHEGLLAQRWAAVHPCPNDSTLTGDVAARRWIVLKQRPIDQFPPLTQRLIAGHWQDVDHELTDLQHRFEAGQASDVELAHAFDGFYIASPLLDAPLLAWLAKAPGSYAAQIVATEHVRAQFEVLWRGGFTADVSAGFNAEGRAASALRHLDAADALLPKPSSFNLLLRYRFSSVVREDMDGWLDRALAANPDDLLMRHEYINWFRLCPCTKGLPDDIAMRRVLAMPASSRVREGLAAWRLFERASEIEGTDRAADLYRQILALQALPQDRYMANINLALILMAHEKNEEALEHLDAAVALLPTNVHAHDVRGAVHEALGQYPQAIADYLADARRSDIAAQHAAGRILLWGKPGVNRDLPEAARWIAEASYLGEREARGVLRSRSDLLTDLERQPIRPLSAGAPLAENASKSHALGEASDRIGQLVATPGG